MDAKIKKVKIKAFPIAAKMTAGAESVNGQVLKLTPSGFLLEAPIGGLKTGDKFQVAFELPVVHFGINEACVVVKLYTTIETSVIEGHFQSLSQDHEKKIMTFLSRIPRTAG